MIPEAKLAQEVYFIKSMQLLKVRHCELLSSQRKDGNMISHQIYSIHRIITSNWTIVGSSGHCP